jgi:hypothetical protein
MQDRFTLFRRGNVFYCEDREPGHWGNTLTICSPPPSAANEPVFTPA